MMKKMTGTERKTGKEGEPVYHKDRKGRGTHRELIWETELFYGKICWHLQGMLIFLRAGLPL